MCILQERAEKFLPKIGPNIRLFFLLWRCVCVCGGSFVTGGVLSVRDVQSCRRKGENLIFFKINMPVNLSLISFTLFKDVMNPYKKIHSLKRTNSVY